MGDVPFVTDVGEAADEINRLRSLLDDLIGTVSALHEPEWYEPEGSVTGVRRLRCSTCGADVPCRTLNQVARIKGVYRG
jgi:hypothetical protein